MTRRLLTTTTALAVALTAPLGVAFAQDEDEAALPVADTIVVTARKREENIADVPISLSAFSEAIIEDRLIDDVSEISDFTPGFQQQQAFGRDGDRPVIRGASNILVAEGKVGYFIDGVPLTGDVSALDFNNLTRIEVIKGPQAAVFGRGTLSGAINFVTKSPGDEHEFFIEGTLGNYERQELNGSWSGPITDWLGAFVNVSYDSFGGDYDNNVTGGNLNERESLSANAFVYFTPTEDLSASVKVLYQDVDDGHFAIDLLDSSFNNTLPLVRGYIDGEVPVPSDSDFGLNTDTIANPGLDRETSQVLLDVDYDIAGSGFVLSYNGTIVEQDEVTGVDQTYDDSQVLLVSALVPPFVDPSGCIGFFPVVNQACGVTAFEGTSATRRNVISHELRLSTPQDQRVRGSLGYFYLDEARKGLTDFLEATEFGLDNLGDRNEIENTAFFGLVEADITDRLTGSFELRYAEDEITRTIQEYTASQYFDPAFLATLSFSNPNELQRNEPAGALAAANLTFDDIRTRSETFDATLPRVTLRYALTDTINLYGQYAEGNSPGGFNDFDAPLSTIDEEELTNFEVGAKGSIPQWNANFAAAVFLQIYENQGLTQTFINEEGNLDSFVAPIGESEALGFEFEGDIQLADGFTLAGTFAYIDAEITEGTITDQGVLFSPGALCLDGENFDETNDPACVGLDSIEGNEPPLVSDIQATLSPRYRAPLGVTDWEWFAGADVIYRSSFFAQVHNLAETGDSTKVNLQAGLTDGRFRLVAWGENVLDDDTPNGILRYVDFAAPRIIPGPPGVRGPRPRAFGITPPAKPTYGVTASVRF